MTSKREASIYKIVASIAVFAFIFIGWKYNNLINAYKTAEKEKVWFCKEYNKLKCNADQFLVHLQTDSLIMIEINELYEENERFASMLAEIENYPCGHAILEKLWNE